MISSWTTGCPASETALVRAPAHGSRVFRRRVAGISSWLTARRGAVQVSEHLLRQSFGKANCGPPLSRRASRKPVAHMRRPCRESDFAFLAQAIIGGEAEEALTVLTGWPCESIHFEREVRTRPARI